MHYAQIDGLDLPIPRIIHGTTMLTGRDDAKEFDVLDAMLDLGCTAFDTARVYPSEVPLGRWVNTRGIREKVTIITKGAHHSDIRKRLTPFDIAADLHDSLARLQTDYIDLLLLHRDDPSVPVEPIIEALNEHVAEGRIRAFGASNWSHTRIARANRYAAETGLLPFAVSSPNFSLAVRLREPWAGCLTITGDENLPARRSYARSRMPLLAWSSFAAGFFSGRYDRGHPASMAEFPGGYDLCFDCYCHEINFQRLDRARDLARERNLTVPQVALAYVFNQPMNLFALLAAGNASEMQSAIDALSIPLSRKDLAWLEWGDRAAPTARRSRHKSR